MSQALFDPEEVVLLAMILPCCPRVVRVSSLLLFGVSLSLGQQSVAIEKQVDALFASYGAGTPGVAVGVVRGGKAVLVKGYGTASLEQGKPVSGTTVFQVGSVSKQFTAFAVYLLEKQGKLALGDEVRKYVPEWPDYGAPVRIEHLLGHTSGVRDQAALLTLAGWRMDDVMTTGQVLRVLRRQRELNFAPGSAYLYSNSGYTLLAEIVRRVSGQSLAEFARRNIFEPLGMTRTQFLDDHERVIANRAECYQRVGEVWKRVNLNDGVAGPSNLYTTAEDMTKWALNFENPRVGDRELMRRFNEPSVLNNGERAVYYSQPGDVGYHAKGQVVRVHRGLAVLSHGGHAGGFRSSFWRFPGERFAVVLLSNDEHFAQLAKAEAMVELYLKDRMKPEGPAATTAGAGNAAAAGAGGPAASARLAEYAGRYFNEELETAYTAEVVDGKLRLVHLRHGEIPLTGAGPEAFTGRIEFPVQVEFRRGAGGAVVEMSVSNFGAKNVRFRK